LNTERLNKLKKKNIIKDVFEYEGEGVDYKLKEIYQFFEQEFVNLFESYAELFEIKNPIFYIKNGFHCNAFARKVKNQNIIGITNGYPILMYEKFRKDYFQSIIFVALKNNKSISDAYADLFEDPNFEFNQFMLNCSIQYTFGHEFRHILQFNSLSLKKEYLFTENLNHNQFSMKKHAWEFDADRMATFHVLKFVFEKNRELKDSSASKLKCLSYLGVASMIITKLLFYYGIMNQHQKYKIFKNDFYTKKYSHPHPLIRTVFL
jgi:hypothetical protein